MKLFKKNIEFIDKNKHKIILDVEITDRNGYPEFTVSGQALEVYGQIIDKIVYRTNEQRQLLDLWKEYHLKNVLSFPVNVSFHPDFSEHVQGLLEAIEEEHRKYLEKQEGRSIYVLMEEFGVDESLREACEAYMEVSREDDLRDFEESYEGEFGSDEDFARYIAEEIGAINNNIGWPHRCIDWQLASRELMFDYVESHGFYFRNL